MLSLRRCPGVCCPGGSPYGLHWLKRAARAGAATGPGCSVNSHAAAWLRAACSPVLCGTFQALCNGFEAHPAAVRPACPGRPPPPPLYHLTAQRPPPAASSHAACRSHDRAPPRGNPAPQLLVHGEAKPSAPPLASATPLACYRRAGRVLRAAPPCCPVCLPACPRLQSILTMAAVATCLRAFALHQYTQRLSELAVSAYIALCLARMPPRALPLPHAWWPSLAVLGLLAGSAGNGCDSSSAPLPLSLLSLLSLCASATPAGHARLEPSSPHACPRRRRCTSRARAGRGRAATAAAPPAAAPRR